MNMQSVISSDIASIGYEDELLHIRFNSGGLYAYHNVSQSIYNGLMSAGSHGKYFHAYIKGRYNDSKIS